MTDRNDTRNDNPMDPANAATDPNAARQQNQVKEDHAALQESARRVAASVPPEVRNTPVRSDLHDETPAGPAGTADDARENAEAARESARRVEESLRK